MKHAAVILLAFAIWLTMAPVGQAQGDASRHRPMPRSGTLAVGDAAPDFKLQQLNTNNIVQLSSFAGKRPVVLIFGSYTWPPFRAQSGSLERIYQTYKDRVAFFLVYIREAHPDDGWQVPANRRDGIVVNDAKTLGDRAKLAETCSAKLNLSMPVLVDTMDDTVNKAYAAWPDRIYVVSKEGKVAYKGAPGPRGFSSIELESFLKNLFPEKK